MKLVVTLPVFSAQLQAPRNADNVIAPGTDQYDLDGRQDAWGIQSVLQDIHSIGKWQSTFSLFGNFSDVLRSNPIGADPTSGVLRPLSKPILECRGTGLFFRSRRRFPVPIEPWIGSRRRGYLERFVRQSLPKGCLVCGGRRT